MASCLRAPPMLLQQLLLVASTAALLHSTAGDEPYRAEPVRVDYYMEALCPFCANYTLTQLKPLFANKLINYVQLDLIPWGNAHMDSQDAGKVVCQHGPLECELNRLLSCAISQAPLQDDWFPFLACIEDIVLSTDPDKIVVEDAAHTCAVHAGLVTQKLLECYNGDLGVMLQRRAAQRTAALKPAHRWVPWITVNGIPLLDDDNNIQRYICTVIYYTHRGAQRPKACLELLADVPSEPVVAESPKQSMQHDAHPAVGRKMRHCKRSTWFNSLTQVS